MKKIFFALIGAVAFGAFLTSCTKNISELNSNGKSPESVPANTLFTYSEKKLVDYYTSPSTSINVFRTLAQEWTENTYVYAARYIFSAYTPQSGWWNNLYDGVLKNMEDAKGKYANDELRADVLKNDRIVADILEVYTYHLLTATYGDIPYTESLNTDIPFPKYDSSQTIYKDLLYRLDTCISGINTSAESMGTADQIYGGDMSLWKKFAASLQLKIAMDLADYDATTSSKYVNSAITTGIFTSNSDNASMTYSTTATANVNPIAAAMTSPYTTRRDFCPAGYLVNTMLGWSDPRLGLYFNKYNGSYKGGTAGSSNSYSLNSTFSSTLLSPVYPGTILDYSTTQFLLAEAVERGFISGTASTYYNSAITASILFWGGTATDASTYLAKSGVSYSTATGTWRQKLGYQKWIANFNNSWDAWTDIRRLGYPDINTVSKPNSASSSFPLRLTYPSNESGSNSTNWEEASAHLSDGDVVTSKLFWMR